MPYSPDQIRLTSAGGSDDMQQQQQQLSFPARTSSSTSSSLLLAAHQPPSASNTISIFLSPSPADLPTYSPGCDPVLRRSDSKYRLGQLAKDTTPPPPRALLPNIHSEAVAWTPGYRTRHLTLVSSPNHPSQDHPHFELQERQLQRVRSFESHAHGIAKNLTAAPLLRSKSLPPHHTAAFQEDSASSSERAGYMAQHESASDEDLFLELAQDHTITADTFNHGSRRSSQAYHTKHHSIPNSDGITSAVVGSRRPKSSGQVFARPQTSYETYSQSPYRFERHQSPLSAAPHESSSAAPLSPSRRHVRRSLATEHVPTSPKSRLSHRLTSPDIPDFGRRRPSLQVYSSQLNNAIDSPDESPQESSDQHISNPDSNSAESQTAASTVWDELDDLKSRIKKLELTGKLPPTSGAAVATTYERPRTATTAPTTVDSSPKQERRARNISAHVEPPQEPQQVTSPTTNSNSHPLLHAALAKAKPLVNSSLYRVLEATAADALHLASLTGSAGPQGTTFSAASIINGVTASDRHLRRKADSMCRNLTDLCIALTEGKHEAGSVGPSPITLQTPRLRTSPTARSSFGSGEGRAPSVTRATSRLEARRSSILGIQSTPQYAGSARSPSSEARTFDQESTVSHTPSHAPSLRRAARASDKLRAPTAIRREEYGREEDTTIRPPSRAMTDFGNFRRSSNGARDILSSAQPPSRSPSLREKLAARRGQNEYSNASSFQQSSTQGSRLRSITDASQPAGDELPAESEATSAGVRRRQSNSYRTPTEGSARSAAPLQRRRWMADN